MLPSLLTTSAVLGLILHCGLTYSAHIENNVQKPSLDAPPQPENQIVRPAVNSNFADPAYIRVGDLFYASATNKFGSAPPTGEQQINIQIATSPDFSTWTLLENTDALPFAGAWSAGTQVWAPDFVEISGNFILYYSALTKNDTQKHCIGVATSSNITGPYAPSSEPLICPLPQGGAIDPEGFVDVDGSRYLIYKVDGNSLNSGAKDLHPTPLMLQQVSALDGVSLIGSAIQLLDRTEADGPLIEAPAMARYSSRDSTDAPLYVLFYSSNDFTTPNYSISYAIASSVKGPFVRSGAPLLKSGDAGGRLVGPGGLDCGVDGKRAVFHSIDPNADGKHGAGIGGVVRTMWTADVDLSL